MNSDIPYRSEVFKITNDLSVIVRGRFIDVEVEMVDEEDTDEEDDGEW